MKKALNGSQGKAALVAFLVLAAILFASCGDHRPTPERIIVPIPIHWNDSSSAGNGTGATPKIILVNPVGVTAGTVLLFECASKDCERHPKILFEFAIPRDLPPNTEMSLSFRPPPRAIK